MHCIFGINQKSHYVTVYMTYTVKMHDGNNGTVLFLDTDVVNILYLQCICFMKESALGLTLIWF